jgi:histone deacetylase complex regulatory component SIN3
MIRKMNRLTSLYGMVLLLTWSAAAAAAESAPVGEETIVQARSIKDLRKDVKKAEDRFRSLYNDLNQDPQQHILCKEDDSATGTRFKKRTCATAAMHAANADGITESMAQMQLDSGVAQQSSAAGAVGAAGPLEGTAATNNSARNAVGQLPLESPLNLQVQRDAFQKNVDKLIAEHPDLRKRYEEYLQARQQLAAAEARSPHPPGS